MSAVGCGDIKICIFVQMTKPEFNIFKPTEKTVTKA